MDLNVPESGEGYQLVDLPPVPAPAPAATPVVASNGPVAGTQAEGADTAPASSAAAANGPAPPKPPRPKRRAPRRRWDIPAWGVSLLVHFGVLSTMALATLTPEVRKAVVNLNTALVDMKSMGAEEPLPILADPSNMPREEAVGSSVPTTSQGIGSGTGAPSATPNIAVGSGVGAISERTSLPGIQVVAQVSGLSLMPSAPARDLGGGGMISGDVTYETSDVGVALDQLARGILRPP
jgi:hypothetical protein